MKKAERMRGGREEEEERRRRRNEVRGGRRGGGGGGKEKFGRKWKAGIRKDWEEEGGGRVED
ncbi:hypothetical protein EAE99_005666 [Botrytis elliptica]|nr:hypothetical protein EAE99_005666 [Botrytis elliptica]